MTDSILAYVHTLKKQGLINRHELREYITDARVV